MSLETALASEPTARKISRRRLVTGAALLTAAPILNAAEITATSLGTAAVIAGKTDALITGRALVAKALETPRIAAPALVTPDENWVLPLDKASGATVFLDAQNAFFEMLRYESRVPLVAELALGALNDAQELKQKPGNPRAGLGYLKAKGVERFFKIANSSGYKLDSANPNLLAAEYANSAVTIYGTGGRLPLADYQRMNLIRSDLPSGMTASQAFWAEDGPGWLYYRRIEGDQKAVDTPGQEPWKTGRERYSHAAGNFYLAFKMLQYLEEGNPLKDAIPNGLRLALTLGRTFRIINSNRDFALAFSYLSELGYEGKGTLSKENWYAWQNGKDFVEGFIAPDASRDIAASDYGGHIGVIFYEMSKQGKSLERFIKAADQPRFKNAGTNPRLEPIK